MVKDSNFYLNLALELETSGQWFKAVSAYRKALSKSEEPWRIHIALGNLLHRQADYQGAISEYENAIQLNANSSEIHYNIANSYADAGDLNSAVQHYQQALQIQPDFYPALKELGVIYQQQGKISQALNAYNEVLKINPDYAEGHASLAGLHARQGLIQNAVHHYRIALKIKPSLHQIHSNLLFFINFDPSFDSETIFHEYRLWNESHAKNLFIQKNFSNTPDLSRKLRLGFISPDFKEHVVGSYLQIFFQHANRNDFQFFCYANVRRPDEATQFFQKKANTWRDILNHSDEEVAQLIKKDQIDILIDLSGHMSDNRLLIFARKPAPIQITQFGYPNTTGLDTMDFRLTDFDMDPEGLTEKYHTEKLIRLPRCIFCYRPIENSPDVSTLPFFENDYFTFGSLNNFAKVSDNTINLWSKLLKQIPNSKLLILIQGGEENSDAVMQRFTPLDISFDRLKLKNLCSRKTFLELHHEVDIALDPFPYNGGITTLDALWMGVPVITLKGNTSCSRHGVSILKNLNIPEFIASTEKEYLQIVLDLLKEPQRLQNLRYSLRQRMQQSPLMDEASYTRDLENAYRKIWTLWCSTNSTS